MRKVVLYMAALVMANAALAQSPADLRSGDMEKLVFLEAPMAVPPGVYLAPDGSEVALDGPGKVRLVNFWATWCAPCREEMPTLSALQAALGGEAFEVVTIATGRNSPEGMAAFFDEIGVTNLPLNTDPRQGLARSMGVLGLPVTILIDAEGREVARLLGDADWNSESAQAVIGAVIAGQ